MQAKPLSLAHFIGGDTRVTGPVLNKQPLEDPNTKGLEIDSKPVPTFLSKRPEFLNESSKVALPGMVQKAKSLPITGGNASLTNASQTKTSTPPSSVGKHEPSKVWPPVTSSTYTSSPKVDASSSLLDAPISETLTSPSADDNSFKDLSKASPSIDTTFKPSIERNATRSFAAPSTQTSFDSSTSIRPTQSTSIKDNPSIDTTFKPSIEPNATRSFAAPSTKSSFDSSTSIRPTQTTSIKDNMVQEDMAPAFQRKTTERIPSSSIAKLQGSSIVASRLQWSKNLESESNPPSPSTKSSQDLPSVKSTPIKRASVLDRWAPTENSSPSPSVSSPKPLYGGDVHATSKSDDTLPSNHEKESLPNLQNTGSSTLAQLNRDRAKGPRRSLPRASATAVSSSQSPESVPLHSNVPKAIYSDKPKLPPGSMALPGMIPLTKSVASSPIPQITSVPEPSVQSYRKLPEFSIRDNADEQTEDLFSYVDQQIADLPPPLTPEAEDLLDDDDPIDPSSLREKSNSMINQETTISSRNGTASHNSNPDTNAKKSNLADLTPRSTGVQSIKQTWQDQSETPSKSGRNVTSSAPNSPKPTISAPKPSTPTTGSKSVSTTSTPRSNKSSLTPTLITLPPIPTLPRVDVRLINTILQGQLSPSPQSSKPPQGTPISLEVFNITESNSTLIPQTQQSIFYDTEFLIIVQRIKFNGLARMKLWNWKGLNSQFGNQEFLKVKEMSKRYQSEVEEVLQGEETLELVKAMGSKLILRRVSYFLCSDVT